MAKVDVVVPCYNYGRFLKECVRSVLSQSVDDVRVLIIDDASSDDTALVARRIAVEDSRVEVRVHSQNCGHIETYNEGIDWADSDYFLLLSADDLLVPGALRRATSILDGEPEVVLTHGKGIDWWDNSPFPIVQAEQCSGWTKQNLVREMCAVGTNLVTTPTAIGRTKVQKSIGGYRSTLPHTADMEMWLRFGARGAVARIHAEQAIYRKHSANMSDVYYSADWGDYWHRKAAFDSFFGDKTNSMPEFEGLHRQALHALAEQAVGTGAHLVRSGIRRSERDRIRNGIELLRLSIRLNPKLRYSHLLRQLLRIPGPEALPLPGSIMRQAVARLSGRSQRTL